MRAILLASATVATCLRLRAVRLTSHVLRPEDCLVLLQQHGVRSLHKEFSQVFVSSSAGAGQLLLASGGVLAGHHSQPGSESAALLEGCPVADGCDRGRSSDRSDSGDRDQAPALFKFAADARDQLVGFLDLPVQVLHLQPQLGQKYPQCAGQLVVRRLPGCRVETPQYNGVPCGW